MKKRFPKNLSPKCRKLLLANEGDEKLLVFLEYSSADAQSRVVQALTDMNIQIHSVQQEIKVISIETTAGMLEEIAAIPGVLYIETKSYFSQPDNFDLNE